MSDGSGADLETVPVRQGYARWSETYDTQDNSLIILEEPLLRSLLGDVQELSVADMKTGQKVNVEGYHHQIADYVNAALKAQLQIDRIEEHLADECLLEKSPRAKEYWTEFPEDFDLGWPMLLLMRLGKPITGPPQGA